MKYLIQNRKEFAITVAGFVMAVINLVNAVRHGVLSEETIIAVVFTFFGVLAWYFNMPTSEENCLSTGYMRWLKETNKGKGLGDGLQEEPETEEEEDRLEGEFYE